ncbi:hypothetical protein POM88_026793 [Heracleum sosnowskyi]|uniref:Uncharacterized protein n=1 Tax=Heracleum sosnowskyi TaxID=360622 RepID=A0AAD8I6J1_9APIA|nr:hypothetical protein POM88_026793 [Heracleum sosnowskyi]
MLGVMNTRTSEKLIKFSQNFKSYYNHFSVVNRHTTSNPCAFISTFKSANPFTQQLKGETPPSIYYRAEKRGAKHRYFCNSSGPTKFVKNGTEVEEELTSINKGDIVNLSQLLFTKNRDYLIKCNTGQRVKAGQLLGKCIWWKIWVRGSVLSTCCDERLNFPISEDAVAARQPFLHALLSFPERVYLFSNKGDQDTNRIVEELRKKCGLKFTLRSLEDFVYIEE